MKESAGSGVDPVQSKPQTDTLPADMELFESESPSIVAQISPGPPSPPPVEVLRHHVLSQDPPTEPDHSLIWRYTPTDGQRLYSDVQSVADLSTFVGRILLVITRGGDTKNFEELTGQDGLTFGITDFAGNAGCTDFFRSFYENCLN